MSVSLKVSLRHLPNSDEKRRYTHDVIHSKLDSTALFMVCGNGAVVMEMTELKETSCSKFL